MKTNAAVTTAKRIKIELGSLAFDGYMIEGQTDRDGLPIFGFNLTQAAMILGIATDAKQALKYCLRIMASPFAQTHFPHGFHCLQKIKGEGSDGKNKSLTILTISDFEILLLCSAQAGKPEAVQIQVALTGYSLRKIFSRSFGEVFTDEMAESWIAARFVGIETRNGWTDQIKAWLDSSEASDNKRKWIYVNCSNKLNRALTGHPAKYWTEKLGCDPSTLRNYWNDRHLHDIEAIENLAAKILERTPQDPELALDQAIELLNAEVNPSPYKEEKGYDRLTYMREYMRNKRAKGKAK